MSGPIKPVAEYHPDTDQWFVMVNDQLVSLDHLIDSLVEMRAVLEAQYSGYGYHEVRPCPPNGGE